LWWKAILLVGLVGLAVLILFPLAIQWGSAFVYLVLAG
jgi:hypothetical protein